MSKTANEVVIAAQEKEESALRQIRNALIAHYANTAFDDFRKYVELTNEEFSEFCRITNNATIVYTMPSEETLRADKESESPRFTKGKKFGREQWYIKRQIVGTALAVLTSYSSYIRYMDSKENAVIRDDKKLAAAAAILGISVDELKALKK